MNHTPGPWKFWPYRENKNPIICTGKDASDLSGIAEIFRGDDEGMANARLIASAPETAAECDRLKVVNAELLAALEKARIVMSTEGENDMEEWNIALEAVESALDFAKGQTP